MLVVGRVDVDEVDVELPARARSRRAALTRAGRPGDRLGQAQLELVVGARRPRLQVGHLQARSCCRPGRPPRAARSAATPRSSSARARSRRSPSRIASIRRAVVRLEVARAAAEDLGEVALAALERRELGERSRRARSRSSRLVGDDVGLAERLGVGREVVRVHRRARGARSACPTRVVPAKRSQADRDRQLRGDAAGSAARACASTRGT